MRTIKTLATSAFLTILLFGCGGTAAILSTPVENIGLGRKSQYDQIYQQIKTADETLTKHLGKKNYTKEEVGAIKTEDQALAQAQQIANYMFSNGMDSMADALKEIEDGLKSYCLRRKT